MKKIFSIEYEDFKTIIRVFGIKFSFKNPTKKIEDLYYRLKNFKYEISHEFNKKFLSVPKIVNKEDLVEILINTDKSISRFGDGEFNIIINGKPASQNDTKNIYQGYNEYIVKRAKEILIQDDENLCVCIPNNFENLNKMRNKSKKTWQIVMGKSRKKIYKILNMDKTYYDSFISRPYMDFKKNDKNYKKTQTYFNKLKQIWENKNIIFVEGYGSRLGVGNDLFKNAKSIKRILCPNQSAYEKYDEILKECKKQPKNTLFILALGMTATVLAADLCALGYRALDVGHIDIEYEWFLMKAQDKIEIKNKNVNECGKPNNTLEINDLEYNQQVIAEIL